MTEYSNNFLYDSNPGLIEKFEEMLNVGASYFFDVDEVASIIEHYLDSGSTNKAKKAVRHGLALHPKSSCLLLKEAQTLLLTKQPKKALRILNFLEAAEPLNTEMLLFKAVVHRNLSDHEGTKSCLKKALDATPENKEDIFLDLAFEQEMVNDYEGAIQSLIQCLEINPHYDASLFELGYCFDMAGNIEAGITYFEEFVNDYPYNFIGWYNLASCYEKRGDFEKGIDRIDFCLAIKEDFTNAYILRGNMLTGMERDAEAIDTYTESLLHDADNPMVYAAIGECFERLEQWSPAESNYNHALGIDPLYVDAIMGLGAVKEHQQNLTACLRLYKEALKIDAHNLDNWHVYAETLRNADRLKDAQKAYLHMTGIFPDDEESWILLAEIRNLLTGTTHALETLDEALTILEQSQDAVWHKAKYLILAGRKQEAQELLVESLIVDPDGSKYFLNIFPESIQIANIAALIDLYKAKSADEL